MIAAPQTAVKNVAIVSVGAIGRDVAQRITRDLPGYTVSAVSASTPSNAQRFLSENGIDAAVTDPSEAHLHADIVVECAPARIYRDVAIPTLKAGKTLVSLSVGALLDNWDLVSIAQEYGGRILVPSGAMMGLDALQGAAQDEIYSVKMTTRKPPAGLRGAPYLDGLTIDLDAATEAQRLFSGSAREAISGFPANLNVAIAISLAGIGPDKTQLEVWLDPDVVRNTHHIHVESASAILDFTIENIPTENAATGKLTALSVIALLNKMAAPLAIGT